MKKFVALCVTGLIVSACQFASASDLKSGLQVDDLPAPFNVTDVTGPVAGTKLCYRCQYGSRPVVSIFVRKMDQSLSKWNRYLFLILSISINLGLLFYFKYSNSVRF